MWENNKQAEGFEAAKKRYADIRSTFRYIYQTEGLWAFSKGIFPRMSINVPATALSWGTYELIKSVLIVKKDGED